MADAVIVGGGHNGLVAANLLADAGWQVRVLEAEPEPGGAVRSGELTLPGFVHDRFSSFYPLAAASPVLRRLDLPAHGLRWLRHRVAVAHPASDGTCAYIAEDPDETAAAMEAFAAGDGDRWRRVMALWEEVGPPFVDALLSPFPPVRAGARLVRAVRPRRLPDFARFALLPIRRFGEEQFEGDGGPRMLAGNALHADLMPEQSGGALFGLVLCGLAHQVGFPFPEGGAAGITDALVQRLRTRGVEVECGRDVRRVVVRDGRACAVQTADGEEIAARRAVLADVSAPSLFLDLLDPGHLPSEVVRSLERFEWGAATFKVDWALDGEIPWIHPAARDAGAVHVCEGMDQLSDQAASLARHEVPATPFLVVGQHAKADPTRVPDPGKEVVWAYTHVPQRIRGDAGPDGLTGRWRDEREAAAFADRMEDMIEVVAPGFRDRVLQRTIQTPCDIQDSNQNLRRGALNGGTAQIHQQLVFRPIPGLGRSETPVPGLYLAGSSAHPGGGVHGACGANAARAALREGRLGQRIMGKVVTAPAEPLL